MNLPKLFIGIGVCFLLLGIFFWLAPKIPGLERLGRLPGDIRLEGKYGSFYFPIVTCLLLSLLLSGFMRLFR